MQMGVRKRRKYGASGRGGKWAGIMGMTVGGMRNSADGCERKGVFTVQLVEGEIEHSFRAGCV